MTANITNTITRTGLARDLTSLITIHPEVEAENVKNVNISYVNIIARRMIEDITARGMEDITEIHVAAEML